MVNSKNEKDVRREGANHQIQSVGAVFTFLSLNKIKDSLKESGLLNNGVKMIHSVHDSIMFDVERMHIPYTIDVVQSIMTAVPPSIGFKIAYPVDYKIGSRWGQDLKLEDVLNEQVVST